MDDFTRRRFLTVGGITGTFGLTGSSGLSGISDALRPVENVSALASEGDVSATPTDSPPTIDGEIEPENWPGASVVTSTNKNDAREQETAIRLAYDSENLYVGIDSGFADGWDNHVLLLLAKDSGGSIYDTDAVAVSQPAPSAWPGYNNPNERSGALYDSDRASVVGQPEGTERASQSVDGTVHYEMAIPLSHLDLGPGDTARLLIRTHTPDHGPNERFYWPVRPAEDPDEDLDKWATIQFTEDDESESGWTVEGFENGSLSDWNDVETAQIVSSRAYAGDNSLEITDQQDDGIGNSISLPVVQSSPSNVGAALLIDDGDWNTVSYRLQNSSGDLIHIFRIHHHANSSEKALYYGGGRQTTLRDPVNSYEWYYVELADIQWENNTVGEIRVNGTVEATNVNFANNGDSVSKVTLRVHGANTGPQGYFDDVSIGPALTDVGTVTGSVTDADGNPLSGADVEFDNAATGETEATVSTDGNGEYTIDLPADTSYQATASKDGYAPETATVSVNGGDTHTVDFSLSTGGATTDVWPMFQYNPGNTGITPDGTGVTDSATTGWTYESNKDGAREIVADSDRIYVAVGTNRSDDVDGKVLALSVEDGATVWEKRLDRPIGTSPAVVNGTLYIGTHSFVSTSHSGRDGRLYAFDAATGNELWRIDPVGGVSASPTVVDDTVYFGTKGNDSGILQGTAFAVDASDGQQLWKKVLGWGTFSAPAVNNDYVYIESRDKNHPFYALNRTDGSTVWEYQPPDFKGNATVTDGTVYVTGWRNDERVIALDAQTGNQKWVITPQSGVKTSPAISGETLCFGTTDGVIKAVDTESGSEKWSVDTGNTITASPAIADNIVYFSDHTGKVHALDLSSGEKQWEYQVSQDRITAPIVINGLLLVTDHSGTVYTITGSTDSPSASFTVSPDKPTVGESFTLDASSSDDPDGTIQTYEWDVDNDGTVEKTGQQVTHTFAEAGDFPVTLTVMDDEGNEATETKIIAVFEEVSIEVTRPTTTIRSPVTLQAELEDDNLRDGLTYDWEVSEERTHALLHGDDPETPHVALTPYEEGSYTLTVTVTDAEGATVGLGRQDITVEQSAWDEMVSTTLDGVNWVAELANQYAPVIHFHTDERFSPTRYEAYVENARVYSDEEVVMERPSLVELGDEDEHDEFELGDEDNELQLIGSDESEFQAYQAAYPRTVYASLASTTVEDDESPFGSEGKEYLALTYWLFYLYDPKKGDEDAFPDADWAKALVFAHASDTETITVLLDENGPQWIAAAQHYSGEYVAWEKYREWIERTAPSLPSKPHVYPALGAHSSFLVNTDEYNGSIPAQYRWFPGSDLAVEIRTPPSVPDGRVFGDETGIQTSWSTDSTDTAESYDLLVLPEDGGEPWTQFAGEFSSEIEPPNPLIESQLPWQRENRWADPIPWIEDRMLPEIDVLDAPLSVQLAHFSRNLSGEVTAFTIRRWTNPGVKPHEFVLDATIKTGDAAVEHQYGDQIGLGWSETTTITIPLDDLQLPDNDTVTVSADILTHDPAEATTEDIVYEVERTVPVDIGFGLDAVDASLSTERTVADASTVTPGDELSASITLAHTGDEQHTFFISLTPVGEDGKPYTPAEPIGEPVTLDGGDQRTVEISWTVEASIPEGTYDIELAGWSESDPTDLTNQLVSVTRPDAFTVDKPEGTLEVTTTPENALVTVGDRFTEEAPLTATVPIGTYDLVAVAEGSGEASKKVRVQEGETTTVSIRLGPAPIVGDDPPQDLNGDGLYRDINGDGEFTIGDVQAFFQNRESDVIQNNPVAFNFDGRDPAEVTIADVQALFQDFVEQDASTADQFVDLNLDTLDADDIASLLGDS